MQPKIEEHLKKILHHLYINPLEKCNLQCKICYTKKTGDILSKEQIIKFIERYKKVQSLQTVTFCGGEVFTLQYFPDLVNYLTDKSIFIQIITNGTVDKLDLLDKPNFINLIVSLDGLENYHDKNRGVGNFKKSLKFLKKAQKKGFHIEIFSIVTKQNFTELDKFETFLRKELGKIDVTYHPRKPTAYLNNHPGSNLKGEENGFDFLGKKELQEIYKTKNVFPPKKLGCYQISLMSTGQILGCCEGFTVLGNIHDPIEELIENLKFRLGLYFNQNQCKNCLGCVEAGFICGLAK
jgi:MoaA/NifB/PqqE/SkfB family radical SAM enzyme